MVVKSRRDVSTSPDNGYTYEKDVKPAVTKKSHTTVQLVICVLGIYASFLSWAVLQERVTTTSYGDDNRVFRASNLINSVQASLACLAGVVQLISNGEGLSAAAPKSRAVVKGYIFIAACHALSSPLAYGSLKYVDYVTMLLAKSCKLLPVMGIHLVLYRTKFPLHKYAVVGLVTAGVCIFSLYQPSKSSSAGDNEHKAWGFFLLGLNLLLDGLYNTTQDQMFKEHGKEGLTGTHMMIFMNLFTAIFSGIGFLASPAQLEDAKWFLQNNPVVYRDIFLFGLCGALGQIFIFYTLEKFGSLVLVTTTVTRKMMSMLLSVLLFGHKLASMQWVGVVMVFGGIVAEAVFKRKKKSA